MAEQLRPSEDDPELDPQASAQEIKNYNLQKLERAREDATPVQQELASQHATMTENLSLDLTRRTAEGDKNNIELVNAFAGLLGALEHHSTFGDSEKPLSKAHAEELTKFLKDMAEKLRWEVGPGGRRTKPEK